jgi:hypothetical protein
MTELALMTVEITLPIATAKASASADPKNRPAPWRVPWPSA